MSEQEQAPKTSYGETRSQNRRSGLLSDVVEHAPDAIFVFEAAPADSLEWQIIYVNGAFSSMYRTTAARAIGQPLLDFLGSCALPHDIARTAAGLRHLAPFRTPPMRHRGSRAAVWIETNYRPKIEQGRVLWFAVSRNVTEATVLQQRLTHLSRALDEAHEAIAISVARQGSWRIEYVNRSFSQLLGYAAAEIAGHGWRRLFGRKADEKQLEDYRIGLLSGQKVQAEMLFRRKDGSELLVSLSTKPFTGENPDNALWAVTTLHDVTTIRSEERSLREQALRDPLTGLQNRREFERLLRAAAAMTTAQARAHVLMFIDLDGFKRVNDTEGHDAGDRVLIHVSQTLHRTLLPSDDLARWGGDEFAAILYFCAPEQALKRGKELIDALAASPECRGVGASIGIVPIESGSAVEEIMRRADRLVYEAKAAGRNRVSIADGWSH